ncbi:MAG: hypothetical protein IKT41_05290 [Clostridia bacterium]|nr:hypothetical protein [Clostridia bacterium]
MKKIYIVITYTGTNLSKIIKYYTHSEFSHVSISLDEELEKMYSFGRLNPYNPFWGGFVHEGIDKGTFKRFYKTTASIYSIAVTDEQYEKIENTIKTIEENKKDYKFNILGLFAVGFNKRIERKNYFYCAEFVKHVIETAGIETNLPKIVAPDDFKHIENKVLVYEGVLKKYNKKKIGLPKNPT